VDGSPKFDRLSPREGSGREDCSCVSQARIPLLLEGCIKGFELTAAFSSTRRRPRLSLRASRTSSKYLFTPRGQDRPGECYCVRDHPAKLWGIKRGIQFSLPPFFNHLLSWSITRTPLRSHAPAYMALCLPVPICHSLVTNPAGGRIEYRRSGSARRALALTLRQRPCVRAARLRRFSLGPAPHRQRLGPIECFSSQLCTCLKQCHARGIPSFVELSLQGRAQTDSPDGSGAEVAGHLERLSVSRSRRTSPVAVRSLLLSGAQSPLRVLPRVVPASYHSTQCVRTRHTCADEATSRLLQDILRNPFRSVSKPD
jgi:hypothetical protein